MGAKKIIMLIAVITVFAISAGCDRKDADNDYMTVSDDRAYKELVWNYTIESDIAYGTQNQKLDVYKTGKDGANPAVILLHGGGLTSGDKASAGLLKSLAVDYAKMGYVVVVPNYRLSNTVDTTALNNAMDDAKEAYEWVLSNGAVYGIDTKYVAIGGYSSGADIAINMCYTTYFTEFSSENVFCVIDICGGSLYYGMNDTVKSGCVILHGTQDTTVPYSKSKTFSEHLNTKNIDVLLHPMEGLNHILTSRYDEVRNTIAEYMYKRLTGREVDINLKAEISPEYQKVLDRINNGVAYDVERLDIVVDGALDDWKDTKVINLDKIKDAGTSLPHKNDFSGQVSLAWNQLEPTKLYIAARIKDDNIKDTVAADGKWYQDDCLEIVFDSSKDGKEQQLTKWVIGAGGKDLSVLANSDNTKVAMIKDGDEYVYELSIDISKVPLGTYQSDVSLDFSPEQSVGFSISYNDGEDGNRQHQIGWTAGKSSDRTTLGTLNFK
ncbi:MAG: alpha/beta hydrolase fold domain-containing protein [Lachnospira sp.]|nr:alpha/beta hydrolase fold domain-containing protein [Lachnospira sp.]